MKRLRHSKLVGFLSVNLYAKSMLSVVSAGVNILVYLIVMRLLFKNYGLDAVGFWSLVMALSSVVRLVDISGANTLNRMLPVEAHSESDQVDFIDTMSIFVLVFYFSISVLVFFFSIGYLSNHNTLSNSTSSSLIFVLCLLSVFLNVLSALNQLALDGLGYSQWRSYTVLAGSVICLGTAVFLVPGLGLYGLAIAQICQHAFAIVMGRGLLRRLNQKLTWLPGRFTKNAFVKCWRFGFFFELVNRPKLALDPMVRLIVGSTAGLEALGLYDLANKIIVQVNGLVQAMLSPRVPELADAWSQSDVSLRHTFQQIARLYIPPLMSIYLLVSVAAFGVSLIVFGEVVPLYIFVSSVLLLGYGLASPGLISQIFVQSMADFRWSVTGQALTVLVMLVTLSFIMTDISVQRLTVVVSCSIFLGALVEYLGVHSRHRLPMLWHKDTGIFSVLSVITFVTLVLSFIYYGLMFADWGN